MVHPRAISAGLTDTGAIVSLGGRDSLSPIRSASHLQRSRGDAQRVLLFVSARARVHVEPLHASTVADRTTGDPQLAVGGLACAGSGGAPT